MQLVMLQHSCMLNTSQYITVCGIICDVRARSGCVCPTTYPNSQSDNF